MNDANRGRGTILPPVYLLLSLILMAGLRLFLEGPPIVPLPLRYVGSLLLALGVALVLYVAGLFRRAGTTIRPFQESSALVSQGPFRVSRNPIYLGMVGALIGLALMLGTAAPFLVIPAFAILIDLRFIRAEEADLERVFGEAYRDYKARVRRWL